jgi:nucleoside-diphosphate-sugar epimerase
LHLAQTPHDETDPVKENDPRKVELAVQASGVPYTFLRPQYIYGPNANKRYLDFFIGRAARKLPIPLPLHGEQLVCLTHIEDVCSLIATTLGDERAKNQVHCVAIHYKRALICMNSNNSISINFRVDIQLWYKQVHYIQGTL